MAYGREEVLKYHLGGKVAVSLPKPLKTKDDLCLAYTPGVAHAVKAIAENPGAAWDVTAIPSSARVASTRSCRSKAPTAARSSKKPPASPSSATARKKANAS